MRCGAEFQTFSVRLKESYVTVFSIAIITYVITQWHYCFYHYLQLKLSLGFVYVFFSGKVVETKNDFGISLLEV